VRAACCGVGWTRTVSSADSASSMGFFSSDGGAVTSASSSLEVFSSVDKTSSSFSSSSSSLCSDGIGSTSPPASSKTRISKTNHQTGQYLPSSALLSFPQFQTYFPKLLHFPSLQRQIFFGKAFKSRDIDKSLFPAA
jgi:hypothetical protein